MHKKADAVIVGGGIIGMAVAHYLAKRQFGRIVVVEKEPLPGAGATSKAAGGIRAQFSTKVNITMSILSEKLFASFETDTGQPAVYDRVGYMFLLRDKDSMDQFEESRQLQISLGLNVEMLKPEEIKELLPQLSVNGAVGATFCREDGLGDPYEFMIGYEKSARAKGVEIKYDCELTGIDVVSGKVKSVSTSAGDIETEVVINCAGPQAKLIAAMAGAVLNVEPIRRQIVTTGELDYIPPDFPMVVDVASGLYCHKESKGLLMGWADMDVDSSFDVSVDPNYTDAILEKALELIPKLETAEIANQWAGLYATTPDHHAIIGWDPSVKGLFHVTGFSGHGFMHAPAAGLLTAELLTGRPTSIDITPLSPQRFLKGELVNETNII